MFKFFKKRSEPTTEPVQPRERSYRAISIQPGESPCGRAIALSSKRFLSGEVPKVPLRDCNVATCTCRYRHHEDRRREPRRYSDRAHFPRHYVGPERREQRRGGRRSDDLIFE